MRQGVELCESCSALLTVDLKLTKRAGRLSTVDQVRRSVKLCSRSGTPLTGPHLSGGGGGGAFRKHNSLNRPTILVGKRFSQFGKKLVNLKVYSSSVGGGCEDKPKKQKTHLRGKAGFHKLNSLT